MDVFMLIVSVGLAAHVVVTVRSIQRVRVQEAAAFHAGELGHYALAYLAGGADHVAATAITLLTHTGDLRVSRGARLHRVQAPVSRDAIERAALAAVPRSGISAAALRRETGESPAMDGLRRDLAEQGLVLRGDRLERLRQLVNGLRAVSVLAFVGVAATLLALFAEGARWQLLLWLLLLLSTAVSATVVCEDLRRSRRGELTGDGMERLALAMRTHPQGWGDVPMNVALYGPGASPDAHLREGLGGSRTPRWSRGRASYG
ncbi:TIGR04222 domain-containing membrane protein, partial [Nonomuraea diastatica]